MSQTDADAGCALGDVLCDDVHVVELPGRGKGVEAVTEIPSDTLVAVERPFAVVLEKKWGVALCESCLSPKTVPGCAHCATGGRCDTCTDDKVPAHDAAECKAFRAMEKLVEKKHDDEDGFNPLDMVLLTRLMYRVLMRAGPEADKHVLWSLSRQVSTDPDKTAFRKTASKIVAKVAQRDKNEMWRLCHIIETNCYSVYKKDWYRPSAESDLAAEELVAGMPSVDPEKPIGIATYLSASLFNHSCAPNVTKIRRGTELDIISLRNIEGGEEVCHSYVPSIMSSGKRKDELRHNWGFDCTCSRCKDPVDNWVIDAICSCSGYLVVDPEDDGAARCTACGEWSEV